MRQPAPSGLESLPAVSSPSQPSCTALQLLLNDLICPQQQPGRRLRLSRCWKPVASRVTSHERWVKVFLGINLSEEAPPGVSRDESRFPWGNLGDVIGAAYDDNFSGADETEKLLGELRGSPTDLAKLVATVNQRHRRIVAISAQAIARWNKDDPTSWARVREWLTMRGVRIVSK